MATLDDLLRETEQTPAQPQVQAPPQAAQAPAPVTLDSLLAGQAPPAAPAAQPITLDNLLTQARPDLDSSLDSAPPLTKTQKLEQALKGRGFVGLSEQVFGGLGRTFTDIAQAPQRLVEVFKPDMQPEITSPVSSATYFLDKAAQKIEDSLFVPLPREDGPFISKIPAGVGSALGYITGGVAGQAAKLPGYVAPLVMGTLGSAGNQAEEAKAMQATPEEQMLAFIGGGAFGSTEAIPGAFFLNKLNKIAPAKVAEMIRVYNSNKNPSVLRETLEGFVTEATQEGVQTVGGNWVARDFAAYDPQRTLGENFWENTLTGGLIGSGISGGLSKLRHMEYAEQQAQLEQIRQIALSLNDPINAIAGSFTPVEEYVNLNKMIDDLENQIVEDGQEPVKIPNLGQETKLRNRLSRRAGAPIEMPQKLDKANYFTKLGNALSVDPEIESSLPKNEDGTPLSVGQALEVTPVVVEQVLTYQPQIDKLQGTIEAGERLAAKGTLTDAQKATILRVKETQLAFMVKQKLARKFLKEAKNYVAAFRPYLGEDFKFTIGGNTKLWTESFASPRGGSGFSAMMLMTDNIGHIVIDLDALASAAYVKEEEAGKDPLITKKAANDVYNEVRRRFFESLSHELGHVIFRKNMVDLFNATKARGTPEAEKSLAIMKALTRDYANWLSEVSGLKILDFLTKSYALEGGIDEGQSYKELNIQDKLPPMKDTWPGLYEPKKAYYLNFEEFFAETTSRMATQGAFADDVMTKFFSPVIKQYEKLFELQPGYKSTDIGKNWQKFLKTQSLRMKMKEEAERLEAAGGKNLISALRGLVPGFDPEKFAGLQQNLDKWNEGIALGLNLLQMADSFKHIPHWQTYLSGVFKWQAYQRNFQSDSVDTIKAWRALGKGEASQLTDVLFEEGQTRQRLPGEVLSQRLTADAVLVYEQIRAQLDKVLEEMRLAALDDARATLGQGELLNQELASINEDFDTMKSRGYFPFMRFGEHTLTIRAKEDLEYNGEKYKQGRLIAFEVFETPKARDEARLAFEENPTIRYKAKVDSGTMRESDFVIQGMPRAMLRALKKKVEAAGPMSAEQAAAFERAEQEASPFKSFRKQFMKKKGIHGYSQDAMRSFASYVRHASGHISRVKFSGEMLAGINGMQESVEVIKEIGGRSADRQEMVNWLKRHFDYIMNPANEWAALRGVGFVAMLGYNIKSAFVNFMQLPMVVYPYLSARHGDVAATKAMNNATFVIGDWIKNRKLYIEATASAEDKKRGVLSYALRRGAIGEDGAHFSTDGATGYFDPDPDKVLLREEGTSGFQEERPKYYDLRDLKVADTRDPVVAKAILEKAKEIGQREDDIELEDIDLIDEELASDDPFIDFRLNESALLYRGAQSLGYDGMFLAETGDAQGESSTVYVFQQLDKIKEISLEQWEKNRNAARNPDLKRRRHAELIAVGMHEGWIDQSLATELAIAASEDNVDRALFMPKWQAGWHTFSRWSAVPFHLVEKTNRYVTAIAAYDLEYAKSGDHKKAIAEARLANWTTNFENARWNRPEFIRGKKSVALLFTNYLQNVLYFAVKDKGGRRMMLMLLLMAGLYGLPGAEDAEDLVNASATMLNSALGMKNPKFELKLEIRKMLEELHANPDLILHGLSQSTFGMGHVGELTGIPIPRLDMAGSIGMGNIIPLTEIPGRAMTARSAGDVFLEAAGSAGGAAGNYVEDYFRSFFSSSQDDWKNAEKLMPLMAMRNMSKAARMYVRGGEQTADGSFVAQFDPNDMRDRLELMAQGLGFSPTKMRLGWEREIAMKDAVQFYKLRQTAVLANHNWARYTEDREAIADAMNEIREYNKTVPYPEMKLDAKTIRESLRTYIKDRKVAEMGETSERKYRRLEKSVEEEYPDPWGDSARTEPGGRP